MMTTFDTHLFSSLVEQVETAIQTAGGLTNAAQWIAHNTSHPQNSKRRYTYHEHEWQIQPANDPAPSVVIRKATQIGASEFSLRLALAIVAKFSGISAIYTLPTIRFAQKFAMTRVDPVIAASKKLQRLLSKEVDSNEVKQIGDSFLYFGGCNSTKSAISVPARALFIDELAFSDPAVVSTFASRLGHTPELQRIIRKFSSPLYPNFDISAEFQAGDQKSYFVYHTHCGQWVDTDILVLLTLPGFDRPITELAPADLDRPDIDIDKAFFRCPHCGHPITQQNLCEPSYRAWVPKYPGREVSSYDAGPLVLPSVRTPRTILNDLKEYKSTQRWIQYALGQPCESSSDTITASAIQNAFCLPPNHPPLTGTLIGVDVGKVCHAIYAVRHGEQLHILNAEQLRHDVQATLIKRFDEFRSDLLVIDAGPDNTLAEGVRDTLPYNRGVPCYFVRGSGKAALGFYEFDELTGVVKVNRTRAFDEFVRQFNQGKIRFVTGLPVEDTIRAHLAKLKRLHHTDRVGEEVAAWVSPDPENHFWLATFYCWLASQLSDRQPLIVMPALSTLVGTVRIGNSDQNRLRSHSNL